MKIFKFCCGVTEKMLLLISTFFLVAFIIVVAIDVFARNVSFVPTILWGQEIAMMAFIWSVFTGGAVTYRRREHFKIEILPRKIINNIYVKSALLILAIIFAGVFLTEGLKLAFTIGLKRGSRPSGIPLVLVFLSIPLCGISMILFTIEQFFDLLDSKKNPVEELEA